MNTDLVIGLVIGYVVLTVVFGITTIVWAANRGHSNEAIWPALVPLGVWLWLLPAASRVYFAMLVS